MSTSSIVSAARTTVSGTVSRCRIPVIEVTTSFSDSRCWMLTVVITSMPASQEALDILPALLVSGGPWVTGGCMEVDGVGVGELVDQHHLRPTGQHRGDVELADDHPAVVDVTAGQHLEVADRGLGLRPAMGLDQPDHHVGAAFGAPLSLGEHRVRLPDPRCRTEVDPQHTALHAHQSASRVLSRPSVVGSGQDSCCRARLSSTTLTRGCPRKPQGPSLGVLGHQRLDPVGGQAAGVRDPLHLLVGVAG